jgi:hypothetical protein
VHTLHWWAERSKTDERDAIPEVLKDMKSFGMTQLSLTVSSNSPKTLISIGSAQRKAFSKVKNA